MLAKQIISLLVLPGLMILPAGIATAGDIDVQTDDMRVIVGEDGDVRINSTPTRTINPLHVPTSRVRFPQNLFQRFRSLKTPRTNWKTFGRTSSSYCNGRTITRQSTHSNSSGTATSRIYTSTTTKSC